MQEILLIPTKACGLWHRAVQSMLFKPSAKTWQIQSEKVRLF